VAEVLDVVASACRTVVGMSLGGLTAIRLAAEHPERVARLIVVDVTPGVDELKSAPMAEFVQGPESFASFDELLDRTVRYNPTRSVNSLRRGLLHNAQPPDGRSAWRYDRLRPPRGKLRFAHLWDDVSRCAPTRCSSSAACPGWSRRTTWPSSDAASRVSRSRSSPMRVTPCRATSRCDWRS
jgi:pimeloyl-ACP methyl ester carboxylesterase